MSNPFLTLGIPATSDAQAVRVAYRRLVKLCHPDIVPGGEAQKLQAQEKMIALNLAYEAALKLACRPTVRFEPASLGDSMRLAQRLLDRRMPDSALRVLERCGERCASWYFLHGRVLHALHQYEEAHRSLRKAVHAEPNNNEYRTAALKAYIAERNSHRVVYRVAGWARGLMRAKG
jgi:Flp pilus assembly protein TadD